MENNIVYVLCDGEAYEGYAIVGIYASLQGAIKVAEGLMAERAGTFNYRIDKPAGPNVEMCWADRADYIEIQRRVVEA